jgi:uracil phosphoribosyltransferase
MSNNLHILSHPLVNARLTKLRQVSTTAKEFREVESISVHLGQVCPERSAIGYP